MVSRHYRKRPERRDWRRWRKKSCLAYPNGNVSSRIKRKETKKSVPSNPSQSRMSEIMVNFNLKFENIPWHQLGHLGRLGSESFLVLFSVTCIRDHGLVLRWKSSLKVSCFEVVVFAFIGLVLAYGSGKPKEIWNLTSFERGFGITSKWKWMQKTGRMMRFTKCV